MKSSNNFIAVIIILLTVYWSFSDITPTVMAADEELKTTDFSLVNALYHLKNISQKTHHTGSPEHKVVQDYIVNELHKLGLETEIQQKTVINKKWRASTTPQNIIAKIKGTENGKSLLLLTHYDSNPHSSLGASDAGSGVVTILEGLRAFLAKKEQPKNDIIILFSDAEELGLLGAQAFVENHPLAKNIGLVLNFEARGSGGASYMLMETNGKNKTILTEFLNSNPKYPAANSLMYSIYKKLPNDTDLTVFRENGNINGFNFAFIDDHFDYHTAQDSYERLDRETLQHQAEYFTTSLNYFSNSDLTNTNSDEDYIYVNFPFTKLLTYPFSWVLPMFIIALLIFIALIFFGLKREKITINGLLKGFIPYTIALIICIGLSYGLWLLILMIHPQYADMLHGFTYNGYQYIMAFVCLNSWILFKIYNTCKEAKTTDLFIAPIFMGLVLNYLITQYLPGAGFFIIPIYASLLMLAILIFLNINTRTSATLFAIIAIPTIYIIAPMLQLFPVALGLKILFVSAFLLVLIFGFILPVFHQQKKKNNWQKITGLATIFLFGLATFNSGFSIDNKKPNSIVFIQNSDTDTSYWATYNKTLDGFIKQVFKDDFTEGNLPSIKGKSKYNTNFSFHKKTANKKFSTSIITINEDVVIDNERKLSFTITPTRKINRYEFNNNETIPIKNLEVNGAFYDNGKEFIADEGTLLIYQMANSDKNITMSFTIDKNVKPNITLNEISYDLLSNKKMNLKPRSEIMMPMPFIINDAIIVSKKLTF
ncbi:M20/M25/M40 family metallo-hydrolase [Tenacibaculum sp. AHE15PA]|uniref:M20/M25/M40 family metallo-hydrolase n=1 Tax=unclassified Tenacibaculum TaxID=2635139 RepID=UPI001C4F4DFE|nr:MULTISPECIES: M20/M25/M40 family metallo-hydrolase [unclassified Tenacibaculum]QXP73330.1 M20/M25/M40 family metallo-hydrolase [Tenacibaculum sp. AHE14PA]QXP77243.1 M20/M25/M40 family metallo-hydrolase [Tenacibaculum sp. AHE15PA]